MRQFLTTIFKRCQGDKGWLVLRAFQHDRERVCLNRWTPFAKGFVDEAIAAATEVARRSGKERAVFAPPVCIFGDQILKDGKRFAGESNVVCAPVIAVDLDTHPTESLVSLTSLLGEPTLVAASGGVWGAEDKLHAYWRLGAPARSDAERALLKQARQMASVMIDGDDSAAALSHPLRWPGSWHTKGEPRLCTITDFGDPDREIKLEWAVGVLADALERSGRTWEGRGRTVVPGAGSFKTKEPLAPEILADAARIIPNNDMGWDAWNRMAMAFYDSSHGSADGYEALSEWSAKSSKYTPEGVEERWAHYPSSPPSELSAGTLLHEIRKVEPGYRQPRDLAALWHEPVEDNATAADWPDPIDIFGDADRTGRAAGKFAPADPGAVRAIGSSTQGGLDGVRRIGGAGRHGRRDRSVVARAGPPTGYRVDRTGVAMADACRRTRPREIPHHQGGHTAVARSRYGAVSRLQGPA